MNNETKNEIKNENKKCSRCKKEKEIDNFVKGNKELKMCFRCREICMKSRNKNLCIHKKVRNLCKKCGGSSFCIHNRQRNTCKICKGSSVCIHNRQRSKCKECEGSSFCIHNKIRSTCKICNDEIKITIKNMISQSKESDKKKNRYNQTEFIDKCFVKNLIEDCEDKCYYCNCDLQYIIYQNNLATIERLDNSIGHTKGNCVIACRTCNYSRVGNKINKK